MTYYSARDLARSFRVVRKNTIQIANDIPESKYSDRPAPDTRTAAEMLAHVAALSRWPHRLHGVDKKTSMTSEDFSAYMQETAAYEATLRTKPDIIHALETNGEEFASWLDGLSENTLAETVGFPPPIQPSTKSRFEMILGVKEHEMHHRGQLMLIQRLLGLVPHLTRERQARMARR